MSQLRTEKDVPFDSQTVKSRLQKNALKTTQRDILISGVSPDTVACAALTPEIKILFGFSVIRYGYSATFASTQRG